MNRCPFVADHQHRHGVKWFCGILGIARSSFYYWRSTAEGRAARQQTDTRSAARIQVVHEEPDGTYCVPRRQAGRQACSSEREARLDAFRWLQRYNTRRRHSRLGRRGSKSYEQQPQQHQLR